MNPQENQDYNRRLQELEKELERNQHQPVGEPRSNQPLQRRASDLQANGLMFKRIANWFNSLPKAGKVTVVIIAALVGFSLLRSVLQLVTSLISLALLGAILYLVYKFFVAPQSPK